MASGEVRGRDTGKLAIQHLEKLEVGTQGN